MATKPTPEEITRKKEYQVNQCKKTYMRTRTQERVSKPTITSPKAKKEEVKIINLAIHLEKITAQLNDGRELNISNRDLAGNADLSEFTALQSLNSYNNKFENLEFLNSLPNKNQLKKLNFFGTVLMDLLEYAQQLVNRGHASHNAHVVHLQELVQEKQPPTEIKPKAEQNSQVPVKDSNNNTFYLVGGLYPKEKRTNVYELHLNESDLTGELDLIDFIIKLSNAQRWLDENYPKNGRCQNSEDWHNKGSKRKEINLEGSFRLEGFDNLKNLFCNDDQFTGLVDAGLENLPEKLENITLKERNILICETNTEVLREHTQKPKYILAESKLKEINEEKDGEIQQLQARVNELSKQKLANEQPASELIQLKEINDIVLPNRNSFNFTSLKREIKKLKNENLTSQVENKKSEIEQLTNLINQEKFHFKTRQELQNLIQTKQREVRQLGIQLGNLQIQEQTAQILQTNLPSSSQGNNC
ncbi:8384_t:CDS:2 [Funneliformis geosporum]|uniref:8384_t:CDS:1 n=1 Tax=Funneliformis geosporum TaxID=1117311 RepID=A0A9W4SYK0_9GLOM|nr:8384_t:CDS:2 [Funneliformis geosporum]